MTKPTILTGLRANNDLHIGNYFGALLPIIDMAKNHADEYEVNLFVPDLHSFTTPIDHSLLHDQIMHNVRLFVAAGLPLDNEHIHIYRQSYIPAHSELAWILECFTGFGEMSRMTQFKDKSNDHAKKIVEKIESQLTRNESESKEGNPYKKLFSTFEKYKASHPEFYKETEHIYIEVLKEATQAHKDHIRTLEESIEHLKESAGASRSSVGLFNYPVLMAADILLYGATYVPVGDDQTQHLEFARDIAKRMNHHFGDLFRVPKPVQKQHEFFGNDQGLRIKDLVNPIKKMSKSDELGKGVIFLGDDPEIAAKKIMSATTDSLGKIHYDPLNQPGISNLLQLLSLLADEPLDKTISRYAGQSNYGGLKAETASLMKKFLSSLQNRLEKVDTPTLTAKLQSDEEKMNKIATQTLLKVQQAVGLRPKN